MTHDITLVLADEAATLKLGATLASVLQSGMNLFLYGDLGAGKTTLVRGLLQHLGYAGKVKSPTYTLVEPYALADFNLYHFDLYRFLDEEEWELSGFRDNFNAQSVCIVEWPEKAQNLLPEPDIAIHLIPYNLGRKVMITPKTSLGRCCLNTEQFNTVTANI